MGPFSWGNHRARRWTFLVVVLLMTACGGGGGGGESDDTANVDTQPLPIEPVNPGENETGEIPSTELPVNADVQYGIGADIPAGARNLVGKMTGAEGDVPLAEGGASIKNSTVYPFIAALTEDDHIVLASVEAGVAVELNERSTAIALVRILIDASGIPEAELFAKIAAQPSLDALASAIRATLARNEIPAKNPEILSAANRIAGQIITASLAESGLSSKSIVASKSASAPTVEVDRNLPFKVMSLPIGNVYVTGGLVDVYNSTPLAWSAKASTYNEVPILVDSKASVLLPSAGVLEWAAAKLPNAIFPAGVSLPNDGDRAYYLTILQDTVSRRTNIVELLSSVMQQVADIGSLNETGACSSELVEALYNDELPALVNDTTSKTAADFFAAAGGSAAKLLLNLNAGAPRLCPGSEWVPKRTRLLSKLSSLAARLNVLAKTIETVVGAAEAGTLAGRAYWLLKNWETSQDVLVCVANQKIDSCAAYYEFPEDLTFIEGAAHTPLVDAYEISGARTGIPSSIRFSSSGSAFVVDPVTGKIQAGKSPSMGRILVKDDSTDSKGEAVVVVEKGAVNPATQTLNIGDAATAGIVSSAGKPLIVEGVSFEWFATTPNIVELFPSSNAWLSLFVARNEGTTDLMVSNQASGSMLSSSISVRGSCPRQKNKLLRQSVTTSVPVYHGQPGYAVDGIFDQTVNLPDFSGSFIIDLSSPACFSELMLQPGMSPESGNVSIVLEFYSANGAQRYSQAYNLFMQNNASTVVKLSRNVFDVSRVVITTASSPSWVSWVEIEGY